MEAGQGGGASSTPTYSNVSINRLNSLARGTTPDKVEAKLEKATPPQFKRHAHHWLILHGRYVCKARKPDCPACGVREFCAFKKKTVAA